MTKAATSEALNHIIQLDDPFAKEIGFTSDKFEGYLWRDGDRVLVSFIVSVESGKGNLSALFAAIEAKGLRVAVPTPLGRMEAILRHKGFVMHIEDFQGDGCEVWERPRAEVATV
jgi:hypothetical protein